MRSVADDLRRQQRDETLKLTAHERMQRALRLGQEALLFFMETNRLTREEALRRIRRQRIAGRRPSRCMNYE